MPLSFSKQSARGTVGLDVDGAYLAAVEAFGGHVTRAVSVDLPPGLVNDGEVVDADGLSRALRGFFGENDLPRNVLLGLANQQIVVRSLELPRIDDEHERDVAVRFEAAEAIPMPLEEAVLDHQVIGETFTSDGAPRMQVIVVAARRSMVERLVEAVRGAGLKPESIDLDAFALVRALARPSVSDDGARVYCHLAGVTNLAVAIGSSCRFTRPLSGARDESGHVVPAALAEEIRLSIDFYMAQPDARPVGDVALSGPGSAQEGLAGELEELIGLPVSVAEPVASLPSGEDPRRHAVAAGLAMGVAA